MTLKWKLAGLFFVLSLLPVAVAGYYLLGETEKSFVRGFESRVSGIERGVQDRMVQVGGELSRSLGRIANDPLITRGLIEPLMRNRFYSDDEAGYERALVRDTGRLMTSAVLDTLRIVDLKKGGQVIALGHRMGFEDKSPRLIELIGLTADRGGAFFLHERIDNEQGGTDAVWTLQVAHVIEAGAVRIALLGGRVVDTRFVEDLRGVAGGDTEVALDEPEGRRVAATFAGEAPPVVEGGYTIGERPITNPETPDPVAVVKVFVPRGEIVARTRELWALGGIVLAIIGLSAIVLALAIARRISKPLEGLAQAASEVAAGRRDNPMRVLKGRDEVARLTQAFDRMTQDLALGEERLRQSERVAAWREIARRIAHEIKNPLSPIQISIETLRKARERQHPEFDALFTELTATVLEEVTRMKRIVSEFSDFARMPAPRPQDIDLSELVSQIAGLMRETAPEVRLTLKLPPKVPVHADPDQLRQAVMNLVKNAYEAIDGDPGRDAKGGGSLSVSLEAEGGEAGVVRLTVADNGPGMSADTRARIFTPYFTTKTGGKVAGTGLGLSIVQRIVEEHGGTIQVGSTPGLGTRFTMVLPSRPGNPVQGAATRGSTGPVDAPLSELRTRHGR